MLWVHGGIGDQICAEPTIRFALDTLKGKKISLAALNPDLFHHLHHRLDRIYDTTKQQPPAQKFYNLPLFLNDKSVAWEFLCGAYIHALDAACLFAFRATLPDSYRAIHLYPKPENTERAEALDVPKKKVVFVHPGKHWPSKTFPKEFWDSVIDNLIKRGIRPVLIGATQPAENNKLTSRGTVDVKTEGCLDLRNELSILDTLALFEKSTLRGTSALLTNDSAPLHLAAATRIHIGYISLAKDPELVNSRHRHISHRSKHFGKGGLS